MTYNQIDSLPCSLESHYCEFRTRIREELSDALENGDAATAMRKMYGDFMHALAHTLEQYDAPSHMLETITKL
jgi:hypothetical protein